MGDDEEQVEDLARETDRRAVGLATTGLQRIARAAKNAASAVPRTPSPRIAAFPPSRSAMPDDTSAGRDLYAYAALPSRPASATASGYPIIAGSILVNT